jgi:hypothetical protein
MMIPYDARRQIQEQRQGVSLETFLDEMWSRRNEAVGMIRASGEWPMVRADHAQDRVNVSQLSKKSRRA